MNEGHLTGGATIGHTAGSHSGTRGETGPSGVSGAWAVSQSWTLDVQGQQGAGGTCGCATPAYSWRRKKLLRFLCFASSLSPCFSLTYGSAPVSRPRSSPLAMFPWHDPIRPTESTSSLYYQIYDSSPNSPMSSKPIYTTVCCVQQPGCPTGISNLTWPKSNLFLPQITPPLDSPTSVKNITHPRSHYRRRQWHPTPVLLPGKSHGRRSLVGCSPWGREELDTTEWLHFYFSLSCTGEGDGNPFQCSCLENLRDGGAWWAAVFGVALSRTRLKRLSSSSRSHYQFFLFSRCSPSPVKQQLLPSYSLP